MRSVRKGVSTRRRSQQKSRNDPTNRVAAAVFPQQKTTESVLADSCVFPHLSSSSDLRILSSTRPSQVSPMTDFRQVWCLHAYSGGTVRDSHPVFYSPAALLPHPRALKWNINLLIEYHCFLGLSIEKGTGIPCQVKKMGFASTTGRSPISLAKQI